MTTPKTRRKPQERAADILRAELARLETKAAKSKAAWGADEAAAERGRQYIALLKAGPVVTSSPFVAQDTWHTPEAARLAHQRIGEKAANGTPKCPSCGGSNGWHYDGCTIVPKKEKE